MFRYAHSTGTCIDAGSTEQITEDMVMARRDIFGELAEGVAAMKSHREASSRSAAELCGLP